MNIQHFEIVKSYFPNASLAILSATRLKAFIERIQRKHKKKILLVTSLCPNTLHLLEEMDLHDSDKTVHLGGIDGYPFANLEILESLLKVPDVLLLFIYGPHVMISQKDKKTPLKNTDAYLRACCDATQFTQDQCKNSVTSDHGIPSRSSQVDEIIKLFSTHIHRLVSSADQTMEITEIFYEAIEEKIKAIIKNMNPTVSLILFGGIFINYSEEFDSWCIVRNLRYFPPSSDDYENY